jgi:hypothetical protein
MRTGKVVAIKFTKKHEWKPGKVFHNWAVVID